MLSILYSPVFSFAGAHVKYLVISCCISFSGSLNDTGHNHSIYSP